MWVDFLFGVGMAFTAVGNPGPLQAFYISQALALGWRRTALAALAPVISDGPIIVFVLLVLTNLPSWVLSLIQIGGGLFILYLGVGGWQGLRQRQEGRGAAAANPSTFTTPWQVLSKAVTMNLLNPNPYIVWGTILGPRLLQAWAVSPFQALALLLGFYITFVAGLVLFIIFFGKTGQINPRINQILSLFSVLALFVFGLYQLVTGLLRLFN